MKKYESDFFDKTNDTLVVRWMDNTEVTIATNYDTVEPMVSVIPVRKEKGWCSTVTCIQHLQPMHGRRRFTRQWGR